MRKEKDILKHCPLCKRRKMVCRQDHFPKTLFRIEAECCGPEEERAETFHDIAGQFLHPFTGKPY